MKRNPFGGESGFDLGDALGDMLRDFAENAPAGLKEGMIEDCGSTPEVGRFLAKTGLEVDIRPKLTEIAGKLAEEEQKNEVLQEEYDGFRNAVFEQTKQVSELFGKKKREMRNLRDEKECLEDLNRELCRKYNAVHGGLSDVDSRLRGFIADLKGSGKMKKDDIIEFMESLRDRVSDANDEVNHYPGSFFDPSNSRYVRRMEEKAEAEKKAEEDAAAKAAKKANTGKKTGASKAKSASAGTAS